MQAQKKGRVREVLEAGAQGGEEPVDVKRREAGSCEVGGFLDEGVSGWRLGWGGWRKGWGSWSMGWG